MTRPRREFRPLGRQSSPAQEANMTPRIQLGAALVFAAAAFAPAFADTTQADRDLKTVTSQLERAERILSRAPHYDRTAAQLYAYDQAAKLFMNARRTAAQWASPAFQTVWKDAGHGLVTAYVGQAEIYFDRGSMESAKKHNAAAIAIDPTDGRARNLDVMIEEAEETDFFDKYQGQVAIDRIRARRAGSGMPLRERSVATRR
jgi:tetratricopeptide (TPR) repeat protein